MRGRKTENFITFNGKTMSLKDWAVEYNMLFITLYKRFKAGKEGEELFQRLQLNSKDKTIRVNDEE